jgi:hypothetical protein
MTVKAEVELRQKAERAEPSKKQANGPAMARMTASQRYAELPENAGPQRTTSAAIPQFSARQVYSTIGLYGILLFSALWASINVLSWVWRKLL